MGPTSEQFAIGSTIYYMIEGYEVYGNEWFGEEHLVEVVERLQQKEFPAMDQNETSSIIHNCWHGSFDTIKQLLGAVRALEEVKKQTARAMSTAEIRKQHRVCMQLVDRDILSRMPIPMRSSS